MSEVLIIHAISQFFINNKKKPVCVGVVMQLCVGVVVYSFGML